MRADKGGNRRPIAFISHHSSQVDTARQLKKVLAANGVDGWMAPDDIDPGRPFDQAIVEQVRRSDLIILLFCARSDQSRHVKRELMMAENGDKLIFPVRLENIDADGLAYWLNDYQWVDWFDRRDDTIQRMIDTIKRLVDISVADQAAEDGLPTVVPPAPEESASAGANGAEPETPPEEQQNPETPDDPERGETDGGMKIAPVATGRGTVEDGSGDSASPNRKMIVIARLVLLVLAAILILLFFLPDGETSDEAGPGVLSPSLDCADTALASHAIICGSEALSARERRLADRYEAALAQAEGSNRIALQQGYAAYQARRDQCRTAACVTTVYDAREGELAQFAAPAEPASEAVAEDTPPVDGAVNTPAAQTPAETAPSARIATPERDGPTVEGRPTSAETRPPPQADPPRQSQTTPPQPIGNPGGWVRASDYPANILRNGEEGTSRYQVRVGANGIPTACFTIGSSGHFQLDARACNMVMSRARFRPARDGAGNAVAGLYTGSHRWRAPR
ncbi:MAG: TIR domain-containing protein [Pseudomonadota bacterium]